MTVNKIDCPCDECDCKDADVQAKNFDGKNTVIQVKCLGCHKHHFLAEDDERCQEFFPQPKSKEKTI